MNSARAKRWFQFFLLWTALGLVRGLQSHSSNLYAKVTGFGWWVPVGWALLAAYVWAVLTPFIIRLTRRFPFGVDARSSLRAFSVHLMAGPLFAAIHSVIDATICSYFPPLNPQNQSVGAMLNYDLRVGGFFLVTCYALIVGVVQAGDYLRRLQAERQVASALRAEVAEARLQTLQMQLHPHFLFNTLHAVSTLVTDDPPRAVEMLARVGDLLREALHRSDCLEDPLHDEISFLERYLAIEEVRFKDRLTVRWQIEPATRDFLVPNLILQPLVENALRHGVARRSSPGTVTISARLERDDTRLRLEVCDDGPGLQAAGVSATDATPGLGLANTRARLESMFGLVESNFELTSGAGGASAVLVIPARRAPTPEESALPATCRKDMDAHLVRMAK